MPKIINHLNQFKIFASRHSDPRPSHPLLTIRLSTFGLLLTFNFALLTIQCGLDVEDSTPPSPPVWVQKSLPEDWPERGIDAHESGGIHLEWEPNPEENIDAYLIFGAQYFQDADSLGEYSILGSENLESGISLNFLHSEAETLKKYFYKLKAEDSAGNISSFSDSVGYTLLPRLNATTMIPNGIRDTLNNDRLFSWNYSYSTQMENYCLTILTQDNILAIRLQISPTDYVNGQESWQIPESVVLNSNTIYKWRVDMGAQYVDGLESLGSESDWGSFLYYEN